MSVADLPTKSSIQTEINALVDRDIEQLLGEVVADIEKNKANKRLGGCVPIDRYTSDVIAGVQARLAAQGWSSRCETQQREQYLVIS